MNSLDDRKETAGEPERRHLPKWLPGSSVVALLWLSMVYFGGPTASWALDDSWTQSLGYALKHNLQAGVDYIFTFGPLGYLYCFFSGYDGELFYRYVTWQIVMGLCVSLIFVAQVRNISGKADRVLYLLLVTVVVSSFPHDATYFLAIIASMILATRPSMVAARSRAGYAMLLGFVLLFLAVVSLTKFAHFVLASAGVLSIAFAVWHSRSRTFAMAVPVVFVMFLLCVWLFIGQSILSLPSFMMNSLRIAAGYSDAMTLAFKKAELSIALITMLAVAAMLALTLAGSRRGEHKIIAALVALTTFIAWKAGFVRQVAHSTIFFAFATVVPFLVGYEERARENHARRIRVLRYVAISAALVGLFVAGSATNYKPHNFLTLWSKRIADNVVTLTRLPAHKAGQEERVADLKRKYALPNIRAHVGEASVDIISWGQGLVFLNDLSWRPRPVFQSYAAYTPALIAINGRHYTGATAPEFVIFRLQAIDEQIPLMNDNEALKVVMRDYRPVLAEKGYVLLERDPRGQGLVSAGQTLLEREIAFGESVDIRSLNEKPLQVTLEIRKSWLGRLVSLVFKLVPIYMELETADDFQLSYRVVPGMTGTGFLINPLILTQDDFVGWYTDGNLGRLATFRLDAKIGIMRHLFNRSINVRITEFETTPYPVDELVKADLTANLIPSLSPKP